MKRSRNPVACMIVAVLAAALLLAGCEGGPKEQMGTVLGAGLGAVAGSQIGDGRGQLLAIAAGTLIGSLVGSDVGRSLDKADLAYMHHSQQQALETAPSGTSTAWQNPDSGNSGAIMPQPRGAAGRRHLLPRVPADDHRRRQYGNRLRAGLPPA